MENNIKENNLIEKIYFMQEDVIDEIIKKVNKDLERKLQKIDLEKIFENKSEAKELKEIFNKNEDNYNLKISKYNEEIYKQGFIDGVHLILECYKQ